MIIQGNVGRRHRPLGVRGGGDLASPSCMMAGPAYRLPSQDAQFAYSATCPVIIHYLVRRRLDIGWRLVYHALRGR
jgi:hypothetical protein